MTDNEAYRLLRDRLEDGESLPSEATWIRYVRSFRNAHGLQKNSPRKDRDGRSVIQADRAMRRMKPDIRSEISRLNYWDFANPLGIRLSGCWMVAVAN